MAEPWIFGDGVVIVAMLVTGLELLVAVVVTAVVLSGVTTATVRVPLGLTVELL